MKMSKQIQHKLLWVFLFVSIFSCIEAQEIAKGFCDVPPAWDKIQLNDGIIPAGLSKIFVITNRPYTPDAEGRELFPNDISNFRKVSYFIATCNGTSWQLTFVPDFYEGMRQINDGRNILLFIEGHGKTLPMALSRAFQVQSRYNVALVIFDWPSKNSNFNTSLARVRRCGGNFYNLLLEIKDYRARFMDKSQHLSILAHSLGNYFLSNFVVCGDWQYLSERFIDNLIMNAASIRTKEHGEVLSHLNFSNRVYITSNKNDVVLRGAHLLTSGKMLGNLAIKPLATNAQYVNFTGAAGKEHSYYFGFHSFENDNPAFYYFYHTAFQGDEVNLQDTTLFYPRSTGDGYNVKVSENKQ